MSATTKGIHFGSMKCLLSRAPPPEPGGKMAWQTASDHPDLEAEDVTAALRGRSAPRAEPPSHPRVKVPDRQEPLAEDHRARGRGAVVAFDENRMRVRRLPM